VSSARLVAPAGCRRALLVLCALLPLVPGPAARLSAAATAAASPGPIAGVDPALFSQLRWRLIGPFRGGRTVAAVGVPGQPDVFYIGVNNGGVWKTDDSGRTWRPLFDAQPTQSIGSLAVAPSDPRVIYAGSGEGLQRPDLSVGDGIYKSTDGGETWEHLGLRDGQQIPALRVDPRDPNRVFAAVLGHPYGPNAERGVFRSTDGGKSWEKVLYRDENTGAVEVLFDPADSRVLYASLWAARQAPWEIGASFQVPGSGLYKSADGGTTWQRLSGGLPSAAEGLGRIGIAVAPSRPARIYLQVDADARHGGLYRSDDAGGSFRRVNSETRIWGRGGDFAEVEVDPRDPDVVYVCNTSTYRSTDGGRSFTAIKGAPGGDDYHRLWIDPDRPQVLLLAGDQGAAISRNGGRTWSSWYNQPTAQFYHVITDDRFPYWVYGGQQESGSAGVVSRGNDGEITFRDWHPVGAEEYGYIAPDPLHKNLIYGGKVQRFDWATGQVQDVSPEAVRSGNIRYVRTLPLLFSPVDPRILYFGASVLFKTTDGGRSWQTISPDLTRRQPPAPPVLGPFAAADPQHGSHRGVIYTVAPSFSDVDQLWAGTDDGLIHLTRDGGKSWRDVTPPALTPWSKVSVMEASHFDPAAAYAAVNRFRLDDLRPHVYRTRDFGKSWQEITRGIPGDEVVNTVRGDPVRRGLLFAGTERGVYVSFDDGDGWQSLRLNLPATSVRDLAVHGDDLVAGTHGRSFWVLDDISPLRQLDGGVAAAAGGAARGMAAVGTAPPPPAHLFRPAVAWRLRRDLNTDTPLPPEEPAGRNPPDGAVLDYLLRAPAAGAAAGQQAASAGQPAPASAAAAGPVAAAPGPVAAAAGRVAAAAGQAAAPPSAAPAADGTGEVVLEIADAAGRLVRRFSSADQPRPVDPRELNVPMYWVRPPRELPAAAGMHRFVWDLRYPPPDSLHRDYPIAAVVHDTPAEPLGPLVLPGRYQVKLTAGGQTFTQPLEVAMDPRVRTPADGLAEQLRLASGIVEAMNQDAAALREVEAVRARLAAAAGSGPAAGKGVLAKEVKAFDARAAALAGSPGDEGDPAPPPARARAAGAHGRRAAPEESLRRLNGELERLLVLLDGADEPPTTQQQAGFAELQGRLATLRARWDELRGRDLAALNRRLQRAGIAPVATP
jgi:photosystem II stability/assembly factor-like uncharacterized protein